MSSNYNNKITNINKCIQFKGSNLFPQPTILRIKKSNALKSNKYKIIAHNK